MTKILVIEDEADICAEVMQWLQYEHYTPIGAADGRSGLAAALYEAPDLILCDITMPDMNGYEVLVEVRGNARLGQIPFIFLTAATDRNAMRRGMDLGADDYLTKPFTHAEVLNAVRSRLGKKAALDAQMQSQVETMRQTFAGSEAQRMLRSRMLAMFAHDFRNPLSWILASSEVLRDPAAHLTPERRTRQLDRIDGAVQQLLQMLDDMIAAAEVESKRIEFAPTPMDLPALVEATIDEFRLIDQEAHQFTLHNAFHHMLIADPKLIKRILTNLLSNAIKYSAAGTEISVKLEERNHDVYLEVQDHGMGIPQDSLPHLFEPFYRAVNAQSMKGAGLGLAIVKECVDCHQGSIDVVSEIDNGTRFVVRLPRPSATPPQ
jgi:two-component system sensor histidine kinase/response regulator